jgi:hypothetical protein
VDTLACELYVSIAGKAGVKSRKLVTEIAQSFPEEEKVLARCRDFGPREVAQTR